MIAFDTNVLARLVVEDDQQQFELANRWLRRCEDEGETVLIKVPVLCELIWVLKRIYKASRDELSLIVETLLRDAIFVVEDADSIEEALSRFRGGSADFADYLIGANSLLSGASATLTFDAALQDEEGFTWLDASAEDASGSRES